MIYHRTLGIVVVLLLFLPLVNAYTCDGLDPSDPTVCAGVGTCIEFDECTCPLGYQSTGPSCEVREEGDNCENGLIADGEGSCFDPCATQDCLGNGECVIDQSAQYYFACECYAGYEGEYCEQPVQDGTPCTLMNGNEGVFISGLCVNPCANHGCVYGECYVDYDESDFYSCDCESGWQGDLCNADIDECAYDACNPGEICENIEGSYNCIQVSDPPVAQDLSLNVTEDEQTIFQLMGSDPDGDPITYELVDPPSVEEGIVLLDQNSGFVTFTPELNYYGPSLFTYRVCDSYGICSNAAIVTLNIIPVNDPPIIEGENFTIDEDTALLDQQAQGYDPEGGLLEFILLQNVPSLHGDLMFGSDGLFSFIPKPNWYGATKFKFKATDGELDSDRLFVNIFVDPINDAPEVSIILPSSNGVVQKGTQIDVRVEVYDDSKNQPVILTLESNIDGTLYHATQVLNHIGNFVYREDFMISSLSVGDHILTATLDDQGYTGAGGSLVDSASVAVSVVGVCDGGQYFVEVMGCVDAQPGFYALGGYTTEQIPCPIGMYQNEAGQSHCIQAPLGTFVDITGAINPIPCEPGTYQSMTGQSHCIDASPGYYVQEYGSSNQVMCPANYYCPTRSIEPTACPVGWVSPPGSASVEDCTGDSDGDGVLDHLDNCPDIYNPKQEDLDDNGKGDVCDNARLKKQQALELLEGYSEDAQYKRHKRALALARLQIQRSLKYFDGDMSVKTRTGSKSFLYEYLATKTVLYVEQKSKMNELSEVRKLLGNADRQLALAQLQRAEEAVNKDGKVSKNEKVLLRKAKKSYNGGNTALKRGRVLVSIQAYMRSWIYSSRILYISS